MKIIDGVYAYIWRSIFENNSNMYYFGEPLNILFDPGLKNYMDVRTKEIEKDGVNLDDIKYIVNTHGHQDHFDGSVFFMNKNISIAMYKEEIDFVEKTGPMFAQMMGMEFPKIKYDNILEVGKWKVGNTELEIFHTPGHSPGSICVYWPEKKTLVCGDLIFENSVGRVDFPGGSADLLKDSIKKMSKLDIELLLPGHMGFIKGKKEIMKNFDFIISQYFPIM
jgi:glyoxylase-like metal-dependent hydrolase (beta-lactamase superfamily II)